MNDAPPKKGKRSHRSSPLEVKDIKPKSPSERKTKPSSECTKDTKNAIDVKANSTSDRSSSEVNQVKEIKDKNSNSPVSVGESPSTPKTYSSSQSPIADKKVRHFFSHFSHIYR